MCTSPLLVDNPSVYRHPLYTTSKVTVPCGSCEECRNTYMSSWQTRLSFELADLYKRGGVAIFLTFTFNDENLPHFDLPIYARNFIDNKCTYAGLEPQSCFNREYVLKFLNNLKVNANKLFGPGAYKYFFCSEYGKTTCRPHHHALFFIESGIDPNEFALLCRKLWHYGFMFPKYDEKHNIWIDNDNCPSAITIKSLVGGCKYVAKYVTKDLSFFNLENVKSFLETRYKTLSDTEKKAFDNCLPKHWQSKGLGAVLLRKLEKYSDTELVKKLDTGVTSPLTGKVIPLPNYVVNKLLYKNVRSNRVSKTTGKKLYNRYLSDFGKAYLKRVYLNRVTKLTDKILVSLTDNNLSYYMENIGYPLHIIDKIKTLDISKLCRCIAHYHYVGTNLNDLQLSVFRELYTVRELFSDSISSELYVKQHDTFYKKTAQTPSLSAPMYTSDVLRGGLYQTIFFLHDIFVNISIFKRKLNNMYYQKISDTTDILKSQYYKFNKKFC